MKLKKEIQAIKELNEQEKQAQAQKAAAQGAQLKLPIRKNLKKLLLPSDAILYIFIQVWFDFTAAAAAAHQGGGGGPDGGN